MGNQSAEELANNSVGNVEGKNLTKTGDILTTYLYDSPLIEYLNEGEQPEYVFSSTKVGYEVVDSNGNKREQNEVDGKSYILLTDSRVIFVSGVVGGDEQTSLPYESITSVDREKPCLSFVLKSGKKWKLPLYWDQTAEEDEILKNALQYISDRIPSSDDETNNRDDKTNNRENDGIELSFESHIQVFPQDSEELSSIGAQNILEKLGKETQRNIFGKNDKIQIYSYKGVERVDILTDCIKIGNGNTTISYEDIVHAEIVSGKYLDDVARCIDSHFVRIIVAKYDCPYCDEYSGYLNPLSEHINKIHGDLSNLTEIKRENRQLYYIYFIGRDNHFAPTGFNREIRLKNEPDVSKDDFGRFIEVLNKKCEHLESDIVILNDWVEPAGELRIEGLQKGNASTRGTISGSTESEGASRGVQVGPFTKSNSKSQGSFDGKIDTVTRDNTFSSKIDFIQVDRDRIYVESDPVLDISYSDIDRVAKRDNGVLVEIGQQTYTISDWGSYNITSFDQHNWNDIVSSIQEKIANSTNENEVKKGKTENHSNQTPAEKIQDLKQLYDEEIISKDEFESKKKELLDEL